MHGGQDDSQRRGGVHARRPRRPLGVLLDHLGADRLPAAVRHRHPGQRSDRRDPLGDGGVVGRHDSRPLARASHGAPAQIDRAAVVLRRVSGGGHHDGGVGPRTPQCEGEGRGGAVGAEQKGAPTRPGDDPGRIAGEDLGAVAGVVADDDGETLPDRLAQPGGQAGGGADDDDAVHPIGTRSQRPAQTGRSEPQSGAEGVGEGGRGLDVAPLVGGEQAGGLSAGGGVGILLDPGGHGGDVERAD